MLFCMGRSLHRRSHSRIAMLALFGVLWTQVAIAGHGLCVHALSSLGAPPAATEQKLGCHDHAERAAPDSDVAVCAAHCNQGDQSHESARVPLMMALPTGLPFPRTVVSSAEPIIARFFREPFAKRHGPTAHPTPLLLI